MFMGFNYSHNEPIERSLDVLCVIDKVEKRHIPFLAELSVLGDPFKPRNEVVYVEIVGTIGEKFLGSNGMDVWHGGLTLHLSLRDCDVVGIGNKVI